MQYSSYLGHEDQLSGVEEHRLIGGRGDGLRLLEVRNGLGLEVTVVPDRCADLYRVAFLGRNIGYFSSCGYVHPAHYDQEGAGFLKSFTAGFLTTCGLTAVGTPCEDDGERTRMHGTIGNTPAEHAWWHREADALVVEADVKDARLFGRKLQLHRRLEFSTTENRLTLTDTVENHGDAESPLMVLYHMNMGYPLLSERAQVTIPSDRVTPRNAHAAGGLDTRLQMLPPQPGFEEQCYFHGFDRAGRAAIYNPELGIGLEIAFDPAQLPYLCQWKMLGVHDYVLGLEPGNCLPDGRKAMREQARLRFLAPGEQQQFQLQIRFWED